MNETELLDLVRERCRSEGNTALAARLGISKQYVADILAGRRRIGPTVLRGLGLRREVSYLPAPADERSLNQ